MKNNIYEMAFLLVFEDMFGVNPENPSIFFDELAKINEISTQEEIDMANMLFNNFKMNFSKAKLTIEKATDNFKFSRLARVDAAIMMLSTSLFLANDETFVAKSTITRSMKIAEKFSTQKSAKFINGVLAKIFNMNGENA